MSPRLAAAPRLRRDQGAAGGELGQSTTTGVLPMRPLTIGELLDAALVLLRTRARLLLGLGLALAAAEQALLYPLRQAAHTGTGLIPREGFVRQWVTLIGSGFAAEAFAIAILGGVAAAAALPALIGRSPAWPRRAHTKINVIMVAIAAALLCGAAAAAFGLPWLLVYPLIGLAAPAVVIDRRGAIGALKRSIVLVVKSGLRPGVIRLLGYLGWLFFRWALSAGLVGLIELVPTGMDTDLVPIAGWLLVNALAYPVLGCLDAVLHLETRMRVEGLDIALARAVRRGEPIEPALAAP